MAAQNETQARSGEREAGNILPRMTTCENHAAGKKALLITDYRILRIVLSIDLMRWLFHKTGCAAASDYRGAANHNGCGYGSKRRRRAPRRQINPDTPSTSVLGSGTSVTLKLSKLVTSVTAPEKDV